MTPHDPADVVTDPAAPATSGHHIAHSLSWSAVSAIVFKLGQFGMTVLIARLVAPADFGVFVVALTIYAVVANISDLGVGTAIVREVGNTARIAPTATTISVGTGAVLSVLMVLLAPDLSSALGAPEATSAVQLLALTIVIGSVGSIPAAVLTRDYRQDRRFVADLTTFVVSNVVLVVMALAGEGVMALAWSRVAGQCAGSAMMLVLTSERYAPGFDPVQARRLLAFSLPLAGTSLVGYTVANIDFALVGRLRGPLALGYYNLAFNISSWPVSVFTVMLNNVTIPTMSRARSAGEDLGPHARAAMAFLAVLSFPVSAFCIALASPMVEVLYGARWAPAAPVLAVLGVFGSIRVLIGLSSDILVAQGSSRLLLGLQSVWLVLLVPTMVVCVQRWGSTGAAVAHVVIAGLVVLPAFQWAASRRSSLGFAWIPRAVGVPFVGSVACCVVAGLVAARAPSAFWACAFGGLAGGAVYVAVVQRWFRRELAVIRTVYAAAPSEAPSEALSETPAGPPPPPRVSVVVPCYNYAGFLPEAVRSALDQEGCEVEVVVVDDASTDRSLWVAEELARHDARVRVVRHLTNTGPVATFNDGLAAATGEFLVRLDADDLLTPGSLARATAVCRARPEVGLVYGHPLHFDGERPPARVRSRRLRCRVWRGTDWLELICRTGTNVITSPEVLMRMSVVRRVGGQRPLAHTHDMEMWMRIAAFSDVAYLEDVDQAWHREHPASLSREAESPLGLRILEERRAAFEVLFDGPAGALPEAPRLRDLARRTLAAEALHRASYEFDRRRAPGRDVAPLRDFALHTWPAAPRLPEWHALEARSRAGARWTVHRPWLLLRPLPRILDEWRCRRRWSRTGVFRVPRSPSGRRPVQLRLAHPLTRRQAHRPVPSLTEPVTHEKLEGIAS